MQRLQQIEPISAIQTQPTAILAKLASGPIILAQRSKRAAVLVSCETWDRMADEHEQLQRAHAALLAQIASEPGGTDWEDVKADMKERGLL